MAIYFLAMKSFGRANGSSAVGAIAYRAGERIRDERTGRIHDFSHRRDVMHKEIVLPEEFRRAPPDWTRERAVLWNTAEAAESRKNARVAREYLVALPAELSPDQRIALVRTFSHDLADRYGFAVDFAVHAPRDDPYRDPRNFHAHLVATTREVTREGLGEKTTLELHDKRRYERGLKPGVHEVFFARERWELVANQALREAHVDARIDHRTLQAQGIDREPRPYIPQGAFEIERRGGYSEIATRMRAEHQARVQTRAARSAAAPAAEAQPFSRIPASAAPRIAVPHADTAQVPVSHITQSGRNSPGLEAAPGMVPTPHAAEASMAPAAFQPQSLDEIRRQARENWLRMRQARGAAPATAVDRSSGRDRSPGRDRDGDQDLGR